MFGFVHDATGKLFKLGNVVLAGEGTLSQRVRVCHGALILDDGAILESNNGLAAEGLFLQIGGVIPARPLRIFNPITRTQPHEKPAGSHRFCRD